MTKEIAIKVENLSKVYKLYNAPVDRLKEAIHPFKKKYHKDFYALDNVSFEVKKGETVGIIGKNGSGKSTLLKIITGVLTPTSGKVLVNGRVSALLELGAGFNPEYTGMENIYFQGNLMSVERSEMEAKVQDILDFADIGDFIHQPVKNYSSGMFARLAFAVAINVEPDILIVDEALSVGDAAFQNKCIRKMMDLMQNGTTIFFVSHDIQAINKFCNQAIWLRSGAVALQGDTKMVSNAYMSYSVYGMDTISSNEVTDSSSSPQLKNDVQSYDWLVPTEALEYFGAGVAKITHLGFASKDGQPTSKLVQGEKASFICKIVADETLYDIGVGVLFKDRLNTNILTFNSYMYDAPLMKINKGESYLVKVEFTVPKIFPQEYTVTVALSDGTQSTHNQQHWVHAATTITIISCDFMDDCILTLHKNEVKYSYEQI